MMLPTIVLTFFHPQNQIHPERLTWTPPFGTKTTKSSSQTSVFCVPAVNLRHLRGIRWANLASHAGIEGTGSRRCRYPSRVHETWAPQVFFQGKMGWKGNWTSTGNHQIPTIWNQNVGICAGVFCCLSTSHWNWDKMDSHWVDFIHAPGVKLTDSCITTFPVLLASKNNNIKFHIVSFKDMIYLFIHLPILSSKPVFTTWAPHLDPQDPKGSRIPNSSKSTQEVFDKAPSAYGSDPDPKSETPTGFANVLIWHVTKTDRVKVSSKISRTGLPIWKHKCILTSSCSSPLRSILPWFQHW